MWPGSGRSSTPRACSPGPRTPSKCIGYLTKYLTKQVADCHVPETEAQRAHADRLAEALRYEPCSPTCANWLRYGIQPKNPRPGLIPGACKGKAHRPEHCGYAGRRVLVSRKWSGKTLADHRADRKAWLVETLGLELPDPARYTWAQVTPADPDYLPPEQRLLHVVADRARWKAALTKPGEEPGHPPQDFRQLQESSVTAEGGDMVDLLTIEEVAERLRVSVLTVRWLRQEGPICTCDQGGPSPGMGCSRRDGLAGISPRVHGGGLMGVQRYVLRSGAVRYRARVKFHGREVATRVFERRADATAWEQDQRRRLRLGEWTDPRRGRVPLSDVAADWLNSRGLVKRRTRESDESNWRNYVRPRFGNWPVAAITAAEVSAWVWRPG